MPVGVWKQVRRKVTVSILSSPVTAAPGLGVEVPPPGVDILGVSDFVMAWTLRRISGQI